MFNFATKRNAVKTATQLIVYSASIQATTSALDYVVEPQTETAQNAVEVGGFATGGVLGYFLVGRTDKMIDRIADWRIARKEQKDEAVTE